MRRRIHSAGLTLIEMLIVVMLMAIVMSQVFVVFGAQHAVYVGQGQALEAQQDVRLVANAIASDVRMAGFMVPRVAAVSSIDGGANGADALCTSDPSVMDDDKVADAMSRFDRARLFATVTGGAGSVQLLPSSMDLDRDGDDDFVVNNGIIIADDTSSHCARIESIAGSTISFTPPTPPGFSATPGTGRVTPAVIYEVDGAGIRRNTLLLSTQVEDLQVEFGVDADDDGVLGAGEFPIHGLVASDGSQVLNLRLSVIDRAGEPDPALQNLRRPGAANRVAGPVDGFRRRQITKTLTPRNL